MLLTPHSPLIRDDAECRYDHSLTEKSQSPKLQDAGSNPAGRANEFIEIRPRCRMANALDVSYTT